MKAIIPLLKLILLLPFSLHLLGLPCTSNQASSLSRLIKSRRSESPPKADPWSQIDMMVQSSLSSSVHIGPQDGLMQADKIAGLPGQPDGVNFDQYAGYVTVDPKAGRSLFYYFVESSQNSSTKPLVLWLNGGPGCSSLGYGAMEELGPFRVNNDGKTLSLNPFAWHKVANVLFLETPAGVGYSYSNTSSDYFRAGDKTTAQDSYTFLINWFERFLQYKTRDFFITGESYAGHYVPQLAYTIVTNNKIRNRSTINLKGVAIGNAWMDDNLCEKGIYDFVWSHALISDETHEAINKYCDYASGNLTKDCGQYQDQADSELGKLDIYDIYAPVCDLSSSSSGSGSRTSYSIHHFDPCTDDYVNSYLNLAEVQEAFHARSTKWEACRHFPWNDSPDTMIPTLKQLIASNINVWIYSGDTDGRVPVTASRYVAKALNVPIENAWRPWYCNNEVGGYVVRYKKGLTLATVRGAGHEVPSYQPERALTMISSFLQGLSLPPSA